MRTFWGQAQGPVAVAATLALQRFAATDQAYQIQLFFTRFLFARAAFSPPPAHYSASCGPDGTKCGHFGDKHRARWLWQQPLRSSDLLPQTRRIRYSCFLQDFCLPELLFLLRPHITRPAAVQMGLNADILGTSTGPGGCGSNPCAPAFCCHRPGVSDCTVFGSLFLSFSELLFPLWFLLRPLPPPPKWTYL